MFRRLFTAALAAVSLLSLTSCLDYEEDMIVHNDLSGQVLVTLTLPDTLTGKGGELSSELERAKIEKRLEKTSGVSLERYESTGGRQPKITLLFKFSSLEKLSEAIAANPPAAIWGGRFLVTKEANLTKIDRQLGVGDAGKDLPSFSRALYKTHYDGTIAATNSPQYNQHGHDVRYMTDLLKMLSTQPVHSVTLSKGMPWALILGGLLAVAGAAWYGWEQFGKKKPAPAGGAPRIPTRPPAPTPAPGDTPAAPGPPQRPGPPRRPGPPSKP